MTGLLIAILAGFSAAAMGVAIRMGTTRGAWLSHVYLFVGAGGLLYFLPKAIADGWPPPVVLVTGLIGGVSQYSALHLVRIALARGPLTAVWCAASLGFLPVTGYAMAVLGETVTLGSILSLVSGVGCVLLASTLQANSGTPAPTVRYGVGFAATLVGIVLANGLLSVFIKYLSALPDSAGESQFAAHQNVFLAIIYACILVGVLGEQAWTRRPWVVPRVTLATGVAAAIGSTGYLALIARVAALPAAVVFTASNMAQIAGTFLLAATLIGEPRPRRWYAVLALALLAVIACQVDRLPSKPRPRLNTLPIPPGLATDGKVLTVKDQ